MGRPCAHGCHKILTNWQLAEPAAAREGLHALGYPHISETGRRWRTRWAHRRRAFFGSQRSCDSERTGCGAFRDYRGGSRGRSYRGYAPCPPLVVPGVGIQKRRRAYGDVRRPSSQTNAGRCSYDHDISVRSKTLGFLLKMVVLVVPQPNKKKTRQKNKPTERPTSKKSFEDKLATKGGRKVRHMARTHANFGPTRRRDAYAPCLDRIPRSRLSERGKCRQFLRL